MQVIDCTMFILALMSAQFLFISVTSGECVDSPLTFNVIGISAPMTCPMLENVSVCSIDLSSHCPVTCGACELYECSNSLTQFELDVGTTDPMNLSCGILETLSAEQLTLMCDWDDVFKTCRATCEYCGGNSTSPSAAPSYLPPDFIHLTFDENDLNFLEPFDDYGYDSASYDYFHSSLVLNNWGHYPGKLSPGTGLDYGVVSKDNVAFNKFGDTATIECPGGSFNVRSLWINSSWLPHAPVSFAGITSDGNIETFTHVVADTKTPIMLSDEFLSFTDLVHFSIDTPRDGDVAVMDNIIIQINEDCNIPTRNLHQEGKEPLNFSPIYPRRNLD